ncbi:hypothetical protein N7520_010744 [Penicillium odoratum]|uniref:uncharacterized protein n=1 Tax=Penicillium odoratum TaxID=1167516 RepID=UPI0025477BFF|nr:uncharacterized protein N7520_010744 [Penicillium odoratum]KAJ5745562.1 hypothetical protein N7520_010744 [Penicillium odoratum]
MLHSSTRTRRRSQISGSIREDGTEFAEHVSREAHRLLAIFTQSSTKPPHEQALGCSKSVTHGHTVFHPGKENDIWQIPRIAPEMVEPSTHVPSPKSTLTHNLEPRPKHDSGPSGQAALQERVAGLNADANLKEKPAFPRPPATLVPQKDISSQSLGQSVVATLHSINRPDLHMSSSDPRSTPTPPPFVSSVPSPGGLAPRRSGRAKNTPTTYNLRVLVGLEEPPKSSRDSMSQASRVSHELSPPPDSIPVSSKDPPRMIPNIRKLLWDRELHGCGPSNRIHADMTSDIRPWKSWKGASNDVVALAWSSDSTRFAAGATAQPDEYNRKCNLLLGDLVDSVLYELPDHRIPRPSSSTITEDQLYTSVADMQWAGDRLYTASYDNTVKIWDVSLHKHPSCLQTLKHSSKVIVMALSKSVPNLVATGTDKFHLWDVQEDQAPTCVDLPIVRDTRQKILDLAPTTLAWGHTASTKHFLVGGMAQRILNEYKVPHYGHIGLWTIGQGSVTPRKLIPDSQNIFDIKWHPFLPKFAAASTYSQAMRLPLKTRTVVQVYDCTADSFLVTNRFPCPAADVNETTFCPMNSTYITASCTDGRTYVWDVRYPDKSIHRLSHGDSLHPLNHEHARELTDYGVSVALWGTAIDQFYTGGSDGLLKQWDIRRSPEDVLVANIAKFNEGITSGAFSEDRSHLLIGSQGGGIQVLSSGPCSDPEKAGFDSKAAPEPPCQEISGRETSRALISSAEIERHPIYGPGQGPNYKGPYARWARDVQEDTPLDELKRIPLKDEYQLRQLCGPQVQTQQKLDQNAERELQMQRNIAEARNSQDNRLPNKDMCNGLGVNRPINVTAGDQKKRKKHRVEKDREKRKKRRHGPMITNVDVVHFDLTGDSPEREPTNPPPSKRESSSFSSFIENLEDGLEDDHWWPDSGWYDANICSSD